MYIHGTYDKKYIIPAHAAAIFAFEYNELTKNEKQIVEIANTSSMKKITNGLLWVRILPK